MGVLHNSAISQEQDECQNYLSKQIITYIGNKRSIVPEILKQLNYVSGRLAKKKMRLADVFSGSGVVSRAMKRYADYLVVNDLEDYAKAISECYLSNSSEINWRELTSLVNEVNLQVENSQFDGFFRSYMLQRTTKI